MFRKLRNILAGILLILMPIYIYLAFIEDEALMEPSYDVQMGAQVEAEIAADPEEYPLLSPEEHPEAYAYLQAMVDEIVASDDIKYREVFQYGKVKIINRDDVLNAFCTPGGYIYVYSGLIKYLDAKDHLAGVLGHEIGHAELRHSSIRMQREHGRQRIMEFLLLGTGMGVGDLLRAQMLGELMSLDYGRDQEAASDDRSVIYLQDTQYACNGTAGFFQKMLDAGDDVKIPEFLSSHPDSQARVNAVNGRAQSLGCSTTLTNQDDWKAFQASLPKGVVKEEQAQEN